MLISDVRRDPARLMLFAYVRLRNATLLDSLYKLIRTVHINLVDFPWLNELNLPQDPRMNLQLASTVDVKGTGISRSHLLQVSGKIFINSGDIHLAIGQVIKIAEDCGVYAALFALRICLVTSSKNYMSISDASCADFIKVNMSNHKYLHCNKDVATMVDMSRMKSIVQEIKDGPIAVEDLVEYEYIACISILDCFVALCSCISPMTCSRACDYLLALFEVVNVTDETEPAPVKKYSVDEIDQLCVKLPTTYVILYFILSKLSEQHALSIELGPEGSLTLVKDICDKITETKKEFYIREDDCRAAVVDACNAVWQSVEADELHKIFNSSNALQYDYMNLDPGRADECVDERRRQSIFRVKKKKSVKKDCNVVFSLVSNKVKALYHLWNKLSIESQGTDDDYTKIKVNDKSLDNNDSVLTTSGGEKTEDWAGIVFCSMRLG